MKYPTVSGDIRCDFTDCCSQDFLQVLPEPAAALLRAGKLQEFAIQYPEFRTRFAAELRALREVMGWISKNRDDEAKRRDRGC